MVCSIHKAQVISKHSRLRDLKKKVGNQKEKDYVHGHGSNSDKDGTELMGLHLFCYFVQGLEITQVMM